MTITANPAFAINGGSVGVKASVSAAAAVTASISNVIGVRTVQWSISGTDETTEPSDYTLVQSGSVGQSVACTALAAGTAAILKCIINSGINSATGLPDPIGTTATVKFFVPTSNGYEVGCAGEEYESDATYGSTGLLNSAIRGIAAAPGGAITVTVDNVADTSVAGITILNTTPATAPGDFERSAGLFLKSETWDTGSSSSKEVAWSLQARPTSFAAPQLALYYQKEGGAVTYAAQFAVDALGFVGMFSNFVSLDRVLFSPRVESTGGNLLIGTNDLDVGYGGDVTQNILLGDSAYTFSVRSSLSTFDNSIAFGTTPATAGTIRLENADVITARNAANSANINLLTLNSSNLLVLGQSGTNVSIPGDLDVVGALTVGSFSASVLLATTNIAVGTNYATTGAGRFANDAGLYWRNQANSANVRGIKVDTNDDLVLAESGIPTVVSDSLGVLGAFIAVGTTPATAGALRVANGTGLTSRNSTNSADVSLVYLTGSNRLAIGDGLPAHVDIGAATSGTINALINGVAITSLTATTLSWGQGIDNPTITIADRTSDAASKTLIIKGQVPFNAEGRASGSLQLLIPDADTSDHGSIFFTIGESAPKGLQLWRFLDHLLLDAASEFSIRNSTADPITVENTHGSGVLNLAATTVNITGTTVNLSSTVRVGTGAATFGMADGTGSPGALLTIKGQSTSGSIGGDVLIYGGDGSSKKGNVLLGATGGVGGGAGIVFIPEKQTAPTSATSSGIVLYADGNNLKIMDGTGVARTITAV